MSCEHAGFLRSQMFILSLIFVEDSTRAAFKLPATGRLDRWPCSGCRLVLCR